MSVAELKNSTLHGEICMPPSKSYMHRALICAFLSGEMIKTEACGDDIGATVNALEVLRSNGDTVDCKESASTLRFLLPVAAALGKAVTFTGSGRLPERPIDVYSDLFSKHGVKCEGEKLPIKISGSLTAGRYELPGDISSQFITGLLFALPLLDGDSELILTSPLQSKPYVNMTLNTLKHFGIVMQRSEYGYKVKGNQTYKYAPFEIEGDWSQAAFFIVGGAVSGDVTVKGLNPDSAQGDRQIVEIMRRFGADITCSESGVRVKKSALHGIDIDVSDIPDALPAIAVAAACAKGITTVRGAKRLRLKESDRLGGIANNLKKTGIEVAETNDGLIIRGGKISGAALDGFNDHRLVMAFSISALCAEGETLISCAESVSKSYPGFFDAYRQLGGKADVISDR